MRIQIGLFVCQFAVLTFAGVALAGEIDAETRAIYDEGTADFEAGRFDKALAAFTEVYNRTGEPKVLYNLGAAAEGMGDLERAEAYYRLYLEEVPDAEDAAEVRARIEGLSAPPAEQSAQGDPEGPSEPAPGRLEAATVDAETFYRDEEESKSLGPVWQSTALGVGGMILVGGAISAGIAKSRYDGLEVACSPNCTDDQVSSARGPAIAADVLFVVGAVAVTAGAVGLVLFKKKQRKSEAAIRWTPGVSPNGAFLGAEGSF